MSLQGYFLAFRFHIAGVSLFLVNYVFPESPRTILSFFQKKCFTRESFYNEQIQVIFMVFDIQGIAHQSDRGMD